jgi:2,3,4,5-tetrahydropyridine-2-carboxylate N-succinyltransferase
MTEPLKGEALLDALEAGTVRAAYKQDGVWIVPAWVKSAILDVFRSSSIVPAGIEVRTGSDLAFCDKDAFPVRRFDAESGVRLVPGGSSVRRGSHLAKGVVCMPPMYVNVGAFVGAGSMIDSHALVGSCAQIGEGVHLSAAAQIGGVLEPVGARPVIVEDGAFIGGGAGIYEGVLIGAGAVIAAGVVLTASTPVFDLVKGTELRGSGENPLSIPAGAVVVPGTRPAPGEFARSKGLAISCALIVKYRDAGTDASVCMEEALRSQ